MTHNKWVVALIAVCIFATGGATGVLIALAVSNSGKEDEMLDTVAAIIEKSPAEVEEAYEQALDASAQDEVEGLMEFLEDSGTIDGDEAAQLRDWMDSRPKGAYSLLPLALSGGAVKDLYDIGPDDYGFTWPDGPEGEAAVEMMAQALGVDEKALREAFEQAGKQIEGRQTIEALRSVVDDLESEGAVTRREANDLKDWVEEMPGFLLQRDLMAESGGYYRYEELEFRPRGLWDFDFDPELKTFEYFDGDSWRGFPEKDYRRDGDWEFKLPDAPGGMAPRYEWRERSYVYPDGIGELFDWVLELIEELGIDALEGVWEDDTPPLFDRWERSYTYPEEGVEIPAWALDILKELDIDDLEALFDDTDSPSPEERSRDFPTPDDGDEIPAWILDFLKELDIDDFEGPDEDDSTSPGPERRSGDLFGQSDGDDVPAWILDILNNLDLDDLDWLDEETLQQGMEALDEDFPLPGGSEAMREWAMEMLRAIQSEAGDGEEQ